MDKIKKVKCSRCENVFDMPVNFIGTIYCESCEPVSAPQNSAESLDLKKFRELNITRAVEGFKCYKEQPITYWTTALAGEIGELCNIVKKMERVARGGIDGGSSYTAKDITTEMMKEEVGGIAIYLDLLASLLNISLEDAIIETFNSKSEKYGFKQYLQTEYRSQSLPSEDWQSIIAKHSKNYLKWSNNDNSSLYRLQLNGCEVKAIIDYLQSKPPIK